MVFATTEQRRPLSVLAVLSEANGSGILSALRPHYSLICRSIQQALQSAPCFAPDVVLIDQDLVGAIQLDINTLDRPGCKEPVLIALTDRMGRCEVPRGYQFALGRPICTSELEEILANVSQELEVDTPLMLTSA